MGNKQLYRAISYKQLYYAYAKHTKKHTAIENALISMRKQASAKFGKYDFKDIYVREQINGVNKWIKCQLTQKSLMLSCGHS